ncbi:MAG: hypothetical protein ACE5EE_05755 [Fidelibacterota bacterium]
MSTIGVLNKKLELFLILKLTLFFLIFTACEESFEKSSPEILPQNTLGEDQVGNGFTGDIDEYFYNFGQDLSAEFYRFTRSNNRINLSYQEYISLYGEVPPLLTLQTFPDFLVEVTPNDYTATQRRVIDTLTIFGQVLEDSVTIFSERFRNLERMDWDTEPQVDLQRYRPVNSEEIQETQTVLYQDTIDIISYAAVIDTPLINSGVMFVDSAEWTDTTYYYSADIPLTFAYTFTFNRTQLGDDSLMFRVNTDCNDNGSWDPAEVNEDLGNGIWDPREAFLDLDENGEYDLNEPFQDRNCNDSWDDAEEFTDSNNNGKYDEGEPFNDIGNGQLDEAEIYRDQNGNGEWDEGEGLFVMNNSPSTLLVSWADVENPLILESIEVGDSLVTRWGDTYFDLIKEVFFVDDKIVEVADIDSQVVLFTNEIIAHLLEGSADGEYFISKSEWDDGKEYDYHMFRIDDHVYQVTQPSFFEPYGYYWSDSELESGFWHRDVFNEEILYYTPNGQLRDGELVEEEYFDTTEVAIYKIEKRFEVESDTLIVPAKKVRGYEEDGVVICYQDNGWPAASIDDCPGADTTLTHCFKITRTLTMIIIGSGVEYGERNETWLARGLGIVRDDLSVRWSEMTGSPEQWTVISRWELGRATASGIGNASRALSQPEKIKLKNLGAQSVFENDPYIFHRTSGFQRVELHLHD